jgi:hypothetical protein
MALRAAFEELFGKTEAARDSAGLDGRQDVKAGT